jgi:uncharacterized membrane protein
LVELEANDKRTTWLFLLISALALAPVTAPLLAASHPVAALLIRGFFSGLCHQDPSRSFQLAGSPIAVCVRCLGIYSGVALSPLLHIKKEIAQRFFASAILLNLLDVATEILHWHGNLPIPRFLLGLLLGSAAGLILLPRTHQSV